MIYALVMSASAPNWRISLGAMSIRLRFTTGSKAGVSMWPCGVSSLPMRPNTSLCVISNRSGIATSWHDDDLPYAGVKKVVHVRGTYHYRCIGTAACAAYGDNVGDRYSPGIGRHNSYLHAHFEPVSK